MIRIVVNSPKGGVGKTTIAMNTALYLARQGQRVWALDLAQGGLMTEQLIATPEFAPENGKNKVTTQELEELPLRFSGSSKFDYLVADTDDYVRILDNLLDRKRKGWRVITPLLPGDYYGLVRIPREIRIVMVGGSLLDDLPILRVVINRCTAAEHGAVRTKVSAILAEQGISSLLASSWIPECSESMAPNFLEDPLFTDSLRRMLQEIGIVL